MGKKKSISSKKVGITEKFQIDSQPGHEQSNNTNVSKMIVNTAEPDHVPPEKSTEAKVESLNREPPFETNDFVNQSNCLSETSKSQDPGSKSEKHSEEPTVQIDHVFISPEPTPEPTNPDMALSTFPVAEDERSISDVAAAKPKKRMTLQERLALAAKSGKTKRTPSSSSISRKVSSPLIAASPSSDISNSPTIPNCNDSIFKEVPVCKAGIESNESLSAEPVLSIQTIEVPTIKTEIQHTKVEELSAEGLLRTLKNVERRFATVESQNCILNKENQMLKKRLESSSSEDPTNCSNYMAIEQKNLIIEQLRKEGEQLSKKELDLNDLIKKLKSKDSDNEYQIRTLKNSIELLNTEKKQLKESAKKNQEKETFLTNKAKALQLQFDNESRSLKDEINKNSILSEKVDTLFRELSEERLNAQRDKARLSRDIERERAQTFNLGEDHNREVKRLEEKIEQLRFQLENDQTLAASKPDEAYMKLNRQYDILQKQYTTATENWQGIEASLMKKIQSLERQIESIKMNELKTSNENHLLSQELERNIISFKDLQAEHKRLSRELETLHVKLENANTNIIELEEKYSKDTLRLSQEKALLEVKVQESEKARKTQEQILPQTLYTVNQPHGFDLQSPRPFFGQSQSFSATSFKLKVGTPSSTNWENTIKDIGFGESSTTPLTSRKPSGVNLGNSSNNTSMDALSDFEEEYNEGTHDSASVLTARMDTTFNKNYSNGVGNDSSISGSAFGAAGSSVQMIGKLGNQVRRLEVELSSMKEELEHASDEKKAASEEIVKLMKDNEQVQTYRSQIQSLTKDVESYSSKYERSLEILGEKSELVEELRADISDLKDLLRSQVQQMIALQENSNK